MTWKLSDGGGYIVDAAGYTVNPNLILDEIIRLRRVANAAKARAEKAEGVIKGARIISEDHWIDDIHTSDEHEDARALSLALDEYDIARITSPDQDGGEGER